MRVPLVDLARQHEQIASEVESGIQRTIENTDFILGEAVQTFERAFASFCDVDFCLGVGNGTDALELALRAIDVGPGDEVILPANTFVATALAVVRAGATPVLVDCEVGSHLIGIEKIVDSVNARTRAVIPVHLYGLAVDVVALRREIPGVFFVEDAAQAHGASIGGRTVGSMGHAAGFSFYPGKNLGAYGDGGAVTTDDGDLANRLEALRNWGSTTKYQHPVVGFNSRLDTIQAVVLRAKLERLSEWNHQRAEIAEIYSNALGEISHIELPSVPSGSTHVWHLYVVQVPSRDEVLTKMNAEGIGVGVHYPKSVHLHGAFSHLGHELGDFPNAELLARTGLSLPIFPGMTEAEIEAVIDSLTRAIS